MDNTAGGATTEQATDANTAQGYVARPMPLENYARTPKGDDSAASAWPAGCTD